MHHHRQRMRAVRLLLLLGCVTAGTVAVSGAAQAATKSPTYYVALGDSYSVGLQPGLGATPGYTAVVAERPA